MEDIYFIVIFEWSDSNLPPPLLLGYLKVGLIRFITSVNMSAKNYFHVYNEIQRNVFCAGGVKTKTVEVGVWQKMEIDDFQDVNFKWATSTQK